MVDEEWIRNMPDKYILLIGRWSPFHKGHKYIVDTFINNGKPVCIAIRESEEEYSVSERMLMIQAVYKDKVDEGLVKIISIPDIEGVAVGRSVGYYLVKVPEEIREVSGTKIRADIKLLIKRKYSNVPPEVQEVLDYIHSRRDKGDNS